MDEDIILTPEEKELIYKHRNGYKVYTGMLMILNYKH